MFKYILIGSSKEWYFLKRQKNRIICEMEVDIRNILVREDDKRGRLKSRYYKAIVRQNIYEME